MGRECLPTVAMVLVQLGFAGMNVVSKLALDTGMSPYVLIAYRNLIAAAFLAPVSFYFERGSWMMITKKVLVQLFFSSIFGFLLLPGKRDMLILSVLLRLIAIYVPLGGLQPIQISSATLNQVLYFVGLKTTTPTVACALTNMLPAMTFVMAAVFRMETVRIATPAGQAKVVGTVVCVGGSMIMPFYKGPLLRVWDSPIHWRFADHTSAAAAPASGHAAVVGDVLVIVSCAAWAVWFIIQSKMSERFSAPYTSTTIMCLMAGVQCAAVSATMDRSLLVWKLGFDIRLYSVLYIGVVCSGIAFALMSWCIQLRGPLYVSMFSPLMLVVVAVVGWAILDEKIHVGIAIGSALIVAGLYMVLWGKGREMSKPADLDDDEAAAATETITVDLELNGKDTRNGDTATLPVFCTIPKHETARNGSN